MDFGCINSLNHTRTIIHIDVDCFYAQVEMCKNSSLRSAPVGIQQKNLIVTSNYIAREFGIKKCMLLTDAKRLCPELIIVNGEDLHDYRHFSQKITNLLKGFSPLVERLGLDENFIDVTDLVTEKLKNCVGLKPEGHVFGDINDTMCDCGCTECLTMGSIIALDIRNKIKDELGLTTCAGIAHNKLLAKLVGSKHKPNQQTLIFPNNALELMRTLNFVSEIPGIGHSVSNTLRSIGIMTVSDLQNTDTATLCKKIGPDKAKMFVDLSFGLDVTLVKPTGKPQNIGIEDSSRGIYSQQDVRNKLKELLNRLMILVGENERIPTCVRLIIRVLDKKNKTQVRASKQTSISSSLFNSNNLSYLSESSEDQILAIAMRMFKKIIDTSKPFHLTLVGLSFSKFMDCHSVRKNMLQMFLHKSSDEKHKDNDSSDSDNFLDVSSLEELEPSSKKIKLENVQSDPFDLGRVSEKKLHSKGESFNIVQCPPNICDEVFKVLPPDIQKELWESYKHSSVITNKKKRKQEKPNSILNYLIVDSQD